MRNEIVLLCLVVMLMGNIGIVSAESDVLVYEYKHSDVAITKTWVTITGDSFDGGQGRVIFSNIANYP